MEIPSHLPPPVPPPASRPPAPPEEVAAAVAQVAPQQSVPAFHVGVVAARASEGWSVGPLVVEHARQTQVDVNSVWHKVEQARAAYSVIGDPPPPSTEHTTR